MTPAARPTSTRTGTSRRTQTSSAPGWTRGTTTSRTALPRVVSHTRFSIGPGTRRGYGCAESGDAFLVFTDAAHRGEFRDPNPFLDVQWYLSKYPDVAAAGIHPINHYWHSGWREGRQPGPLFDPAWYLATYPTSTRPGIEPLSHYLRNGRKRGPSPNHLSSRSGTRWYRPRGGLIPWFNPLSWRVDPAGVGNAMPQRPAPWSRHPPPHRRPEHRHPAGVSARGLRHAHPVHRHRCPARRRRRTAVATHGVGQRRRPPLPNVEIVDGSDRSREVVIGEHDLFLATAWWTAQMVRDALPLVRRQRFLYMIQDFEPLFFAASSQYTLAIETYALDHVPIVNSTFLYDHLVEQHAGRFADPSFASTAIVFEPTVDRSMLLPGDAPTVRAKRRLLFYADRRTGCETCSSWASRRCRRRSTTARSTRPSGSSSAWATRSRRSQWAPTAFCDRCRGWTSTRTPSQIRDSDLLLSLMLSPHPSYPPLEMAASGGVAVTTTFGPKSADRLAAISANLIGVEATIDGIATGLARAADRLDDVTGRLQGSRLVAPASWDDVYDVLVPQVSERLAGLGRAIRARTRRRRERASGTTRWRTRRQAARLDEYPLPDLTGDPTFSLLTAVWNTDPL